MQGFLYYFDLVGVAVFAITGALMAGRKAMDLFGVLVVACATALGGGTLRDIILGRHPVAWIRDETCLMVATAAALLTMLWVPRGIHEKGLVLADAFGLAVFTVIGTDIALKHGVPGSTAVIMGVMSAVAGGIIRDIICNEVPLIFQKEIYATACILGALAFLGMRQTEIPYSLSVMVSMLIVLAIRLAGIYWHWSLPRPR